jgi:hypothetical protein
VTAPGEVRAKQANARAAGSSAPRVLVVYLAALASTAGCGRSALTAPAGTEGPVATSVGACGCATPRLFPTYASCGIVADCQDVELSGQLCAADAGCHLVLAVQRVGAGRVAAYGDSTSLGTTYPGLRLGARLSGATSPREASFGDFFACRDAANPTGGYPPLPATVRYLGATLPSQLDGGQALRSEVDVLVWCARGFPSENLHPPTEALVDFVREGGGLLVAFDYAHRPDDPQLVAANTLLAEFGLAFEPTTLPSVDLSVCDR